MVPTLGMDNQGKEERVLARSNPDKCIVKCTTTHECSTTDECCSETKQTEGIYPGSLRIACKTEANIASHVGNYCIEEKASDVGEPGHWSKVKWSNNC